METILQLKQIYSKKEIIALEQSNELSRGLHNVIEHVKWNYPTSDKDLPSALLKYLDEGSHELNKEFVKNLDEKYWEKIDKLKFTMNDVSLQGDKIWELDFTIELPEILNCIQIVDGDNFVCIKENKKGAKLIYNYKRPLNFLLQVVD